MVKAIEKVQLECINYFNSNPYSVETTTSMSRRIGRSINDISRAVDSLKKVNYLIVSENEGEKYFSRLTTGSDKQEQNSVDVSFEKCIKALTRREREIFYLLIEGYTNSHVAEKLVIAPDTVKNHITNLYRKLNVNDRIQIIKLYYDSLK